MKFRRRQREVVVLAGGGVAYVSGGVGTLMRYLIDEWAGRDDLPPIRVVDTRGPGGVAGGIAFFIKAFALLLWLGMTGRAALVHAHMTERGSTARKCILCWLASLFGVPTIIHMHGADFMPFFQVLRPAYRSIVSRVLRRARTVVVLGESWRQFLTDTVGLAPERIAIVMNGARGPAVFQPRRATAGPVRLLFLGRLGDRKGVPELVAALATPEMRARDWHATIAGDGEVERFREAVARAGLDDRVAIPGWVARENTAGLLAVADILVLPSHTEAMPIAVIEALAHGVAVLTTPVGVLPEFLSDGESALLVPPGDPDALARAMIALIDDPATRRRLAVAGRAVFAARLDVSVVADRMARIYLQAMDHSPSAIEERGAPAVPSGRDWSARHVLRCLLNRIEPVRRQADVDALLARLAAPRRAMVVSFINQHAANVAWREPGFAHLLQGADVLLRDGVGVGLCMRAAGVEPGLNMNGTDFIPILAAAYAGRRVALYGTSQPWLDGAAAALRRIGCDLVEVIDGYQEHDEVYVARAAASRPELLILAMGIPRQERVAALIAARIDAPLVIVNGGAIADFLAGKVPRAPRWMRRNGLEWAFRLCREPERLWRRYVPGGIVFVVRVFLLRWRTMKDRAAPSRPLRHFGDFAAAPPPTGSVGDAEKLRF